MPCLIQLASRLLMLLAPAAAKVRAQFDSMSGLHSIEDSRPLPGIDWEVVVDRAQAAKYGADIGSVGNMVQMTTMGYKIGTYRPDDSDDEIEIRVRFPEQHRTIEELNHVRLKDLKCISSVYFVSLSLLLSWTLLLRMYQKLDL